jgi:MFS family permease
MSDRSGWSNVAVALRVRGYRYYQIGRLSLQASSWMYKLAVAWLVWDMTHSAAWLGVFGMLDHLPSLLVMPLAGAIADRFDRMTWIRITQALLLVQAVVLSALIYYDLLTLAILAAMALYYGLVTAAQQPAITAIIPNLVPKEVLTAAYGLNSITFNIARFSGPMLGGIIITTWGEAPAIFGNAIGIAVMSVCLVVIRKEFNQTVKKRETSQRLLQDMKDGVVYAARHPGIGPTIAILIVLSVVSFFIDQLLPNFADGVFGAGAQGLSWMTAATAVGAFIQAGLLASRSGMEGMTRYTFRGIVILGLAMIALTSTTSIWVGLVCVLFIGYSGSVIRVGCMTLLQYSVDADMRGRVASFLSMIYFAGPSIGSLVIGWLSDQFGIRPVVAVCGAITVGIWLWSRHRLPAIAPALETAPKELADSGARA